MMNGLHALTIILIVYALGDVIATKTKAIISMLFVASVVFAIGFWNGLPASIFNDSTLVAFSSVTIGMMLAHMGTTIKISDFVQNWKTVIIVLCSTIGICAGVYFIGRLFVDEYYALASAPVVGGAVVACLVMTEAMNSIGATDAAAFASLVLVIQGIVGFPIASVCCKKEAQRLKTEFAAGRISLQKKSDEKEETGDKPKWRIFPQIPDKYNGDNLMLAKLALVACLSQWLSNLTGGTVNNLVICLVLGVLFREIGFLDEAPLTKANGFTFVIGAALVNVFGSLANTTPSSLLSMLVPLIIVMVIGVISFAVVGILVGKIFGQSWYMSTAMASTALFGFPGTFIVSNEVTNSVAENDEEHELILQSIMPKMVISGMVSVSIVSVVVAGIMAAWI